MSTAACHRGFPLGCETAGAEGVGAREPHAASGGPSLWRSRVGLSGWAGGADQHLPCTQCPQATRDTRLQPGNCGSQGQEQESRGNRALQARGRGVCTTRCPWPVELSPCRKGSYRDSLLRSRKSGEPQGPRIALRSRPHWRPSLACHPYLDGGGNHTRTGAGPEGGWCARTEVGGARLSLAADGCRPGIEGVTLPVTQLPA